MLFFARAIIGIISGASVLWELLANRRKDNVQEVRPTLTRVGAIQKLRVSLPASVAFEDVCRVSQLLRFSPLLG